MAMPWKRAKQVAAALRGNGTFPENYRGSRTIAELTQLFDACFRIQREAHEASGRHIPLVVENVRGTIPWVGRSRWNFGSYHLWGDVPALMPITFKAQKNPGFRFDGSGKSFQSESVARHTESSGYKSQGMNWSDQSKRGQDFTAIASKQQGIKVPTNGPGRRTAPGNGARFTSRDCGDEATKLGGTWFHGYRKGQGPRNHGSNSKARKAASALIAKIPLPLSRHIAATFKPKQTVAA